MNKSKPGSPRACPTGNSPRTRAAEHDALAAIAHLRQADPRLGALIDRIGPHRPTLTPDPYHALVCSITQQQVSMSAAAAMQKKLQAMCPRRKLTPSAVAALEDDQLRAAGLSRQKLRYIRDLTEHFASGKLTARRLRGMSDDDVIAATTEVVGVGRWTAEMLLIFCLQRPDVWPIDDLGLRKAVRNFLGMSEIPAAPVMNQTAEAWRPFRTYASWYLWRSLEGPFMPGIALNPEKARRAT